MADTMVRRCRPLLGTFVEVAVPREWSGAADAAFAAIARIHARMSFHEETSDLARLRHAPAGEAVCVDSETVEVLRAAVMLHRRSGRLFDVAIGANLVAAGFLPRPEGIDLRAMTGTTADIEILDGTHVRCRRPMLIDLGGIAKGHAVDKAAEALIGQGVPRAIVNAGGDLRVIGSEPEIIHLRSADGAIDAAVSLADGALASSSNAHLRQRRRGSEVAPHFAKGRPVLAEQAVSVVAYRCIIADAMTKVALVDPALAKAMLAELGGSIVERPARRRAA